jgi:hypothetical protein
MLGSRSRRAARTKLLAAFLAGAAAAGAGVGAFAYGHTVGRGGAPPDAAPPRIEAQCANLVLPNRVFLPAVAEDEIEQAIDSMDLPIEERQRVEADLAERKYRLVWLTVWDWDTDARRADTVGIASGEYSRDLVLSGERRRIAVPEPLSGFIDIRGERAADGIITVSVLSGLRPIALPHMSPDQTARIEIDSHP